MIQQQSQVIPQLNPVQMLPDQQLHASLRGQAGPFSKFVQQVGPTPPPTKMDFYREAFSDELVPSYRNSNRHYFQRLRKNPIKAAAVALFSAALALPMIAFYGRNQKGGLLAYNHVHFTFASLLMAYPIYHANKTFPKLEEAYELVRQGNPTKGKETFRNALTQAFDKIYHSFLKPLTFAGLAAYIFRMPMLMHYRQWEYQTQGWLIEPGIRKLSKLLFKNKIDHGFLFKRLDAVTKTIQAAGDRFEDKLLHQVPLLKQLKRAQPSD